MKRVRRIAFVVLATLAVGYLGIGLAAFVFQRAMLFPAPSGAREPRQGLVRGEGFVAMHLPGTPAIVHLHGNAEQLADSEWLAGRFVERGFGFYAVEYPGYGLAAATPVSEQAIYTAVEAAVIALEQTVPRDQLILCGQSLGTGVAVEMARRGHGSKLILLAPYTSIPDLVHGSEDWVVPAEMSRRLAKLFPNVTLKVIEGANHNDLLDRPEVIEALIQFAR